MKRFFLTCLLLVSVQNSFAQNPVIENPDSVDEVGTKIKIREIKEYLKTVNPETTCMDEYVKRRKQLMTKLIFSPVTIAAGTVVSFYTGAAAGAGVAHAVGAQDSWAGLGYVVGGLAIGTVVGAASFTADATSGVFNFIDNELILKALAEHHMNRPGPKLEQLYLKISKKMTNPPTIEAFQDLLVNMDESGKLCDGSMVKKPFIRLGSKLKYKMARSRDIRRALSN